MSSEGTEPVKVEGSGGTVKDAATAAPTAEAADASAATETPAGGGPDKVEGAVAGGGGGGGGGGSDSDEEVAEKPSAKAPAKAATPVVEKGPELPVDLNGTWELVKKESDPMGVFLKAMGAPWIAQKMANQMHQTLVLEVTKETFNRAMKMKMGNMDAKLPWNKTSPTKNPRGDEIMATPTIEGKGVLLATTGTKGKVNEAYCREGDRCVLTMHVVTKGIKMRRVFEKSS